MQKKPVIGLLTSILSLATLSPVVFAAPAGSPFAGILDMIRGIFAPFFSGMPDDVTLKILIGFLIFPFVGYLLSLVFKNKPKLGWIVGGVLTLITTIVIPGQLIRGIAYEYATLFMFVLAALPIVGLFLLMQGMKKLFRPDEHPVLYHLTCAGIILLIIIIVNQLIGAFSSSSQFLQNLQYANIQKFPGFALGVLTIMLIYHLLAPLFKWGLPHARGLGGGGGGLPPIPSQQGGRAGGGGWWPPWGRRQRAGGEEQTLRGEEATVTQEEAGEARAAQAAQQQAMLAEERQRLVHQLAALDLRNLQDAQKIIADLNELVRLTQVYKGNPQALQLIAQRLNDIKPADADLQSELAQMKQRMSQLRQAGETTEKMLLTDAQVQQWAKGLMERENISGVRNMLHASAYPDLHEVGIPLEAWQAEKRRIFEKLINAHKQIIASFQKYKQVSDLLAGNVALIETAQNRFITSLQAFVTAVQQTVAGQDQSQNAITAIRDAQTAFGQLNAAILQNQVYEQELEESLRYESQLDQLESRFYQEIVRENQQLIARLEQARERAARDAAAAQSVAAALPRAA